MSNSQPDASVLLVNALVAVGTAQQTKRRNSIVITSNKQQHILQHDEPAIIKNWFEHIEKAINKLVIIINCTKFLHLSNSIIFV